MDEITEEEGGGTVDPQLAAAWSFSEEMASVEIAIAANGDPAGTIPGGSGTSGQVQFAATGWPEVDYSATATGTTAPKPCAVTEVEGDG